MTKPKYNTFSYELKPLFGFKVANKRIFVSHFNLSQGIVVFDKPSYAICHFFSHKECVLLAQKMSEISHLKIVPVRLGVYPKYRPVNSQFYGYGNNIRKVF